MVRTKQAHPQRSIPGRRVVIRRPPPPRKTKPSTGGPKEYPVTLDHFYRPSPEALSNLRPFTLVESEEGALMVSEWDLSLARRIAGMRL